MDSNHKVMVFRLISGTTIASVVVIENATGFSVLEPIELFSYSEDDNGPTYTAGKLYGAYSKGPIIIGRNAVESIAFASDTVATFYYKNIKKLKDFDNETELADDIEGDKQDEDVTESITSTGKTLH